MSGSEFPALRRDPEHLAHSFVFKFVKDNPYSFEGLVHALELVSELRAENPEHENLAVARTVIGSLVWSVDRMVGVNYIQVTVIHEHANLFALLCAMGKRELCNSVL